MARSKRRVANARTKTAQQARVLASRVVYRGPVFRVTYDTVEEPGGIRARRDVVRHSGSVVVMAVDESGPEPLVLLARQYRHAAGGYLWELPAGRIDAGERGLAAARRELREETGYRARRWRRALFYYASPGFLDETMALYLASGLLPGKAEPEEDEMISIRFFPLSGLVRKILRGTIRDGKTIAGVLWLERQRAAGSRQRRATGRRGR